jgi:Resolvase, N terminal domain
MQLAAGAVGITCQKVSEAEAMTAGSSAIRDVLITYNIVRAAELKWLKALVGKVALSVVANS